jgi:L-glyceraldehyde reductase
MVRLSKETKKVKAVGVSNFSVEMLEKVIEATGVVPTMNQIECHPSLIQPELFKYCKPICIRRLWRVADILGKEKNIIITAYSPLGNNLTGKPRAIDAPIIKKIAEKVNKSPAQVLIAWAAHRGFVVIPKSVTPERIRAS